MRVLVALHIVTMLLIASCTGSADKERPGQQLAAQKSPFEELRDQTIKNPKDADAWLRLADLYDASRMYDEETAALKTVIALKPDGRYAYLRLGNTYNRLGKYQDAVRSFLAGAKFPPPDPVLYNNLAVSYGMIGETQKEIAALQKAVSLRPHYSTARYNLGVSLLKMGRRAEAMAQYNELQKFDSGSAAALKKEIDAKRTTS